MRVSVVCPTHDRPARLRRAVAGVLAQEHTDLELLVVADGATPATLAVLDEIGSGDARLEVIEVARTGHPAPLRAVALERADGDAIAYVDDDDVWRPDHLTRLLDVCDEDHPVVVSGAEYRTPGDRLLRRVAGPELAWHPEIAAADPYAEPSRVVHLRGLPEQVGGWRDLGVGLEDYDLWWRLADAGVPFLPVAEATVHLTVADDSRRHAVRCAHVLPVHEVADEAAARELAAALGDPSPRLREATLADLDDWSTDLAADERTVWPVGTDPAPGDWADAVGREATGAVELVAAELQGRWHVAIPLWCAEPIHARVADRVLRRRQSRQLAVLCELAAEHDDPSTPPTTRTPA